MSDEDPTTLAHRCSLSTRNSHAARRREEDSGEGSPSRRQGVVLEATRGATIKGYAREVEGGQTMFEVETTVNGHSRDLLFDASGSLVEIEGATSLVAGPAAVRTALEARGRVLTVEQVTMGKTIAYEATVERNGKKSEATVNADGKPAKP